MKCLERCNKHCEDFTVQLFLADGGKEYDVGSEMHKRNSEGVNKLKQIIEHALAERIQGFHQVFEECM